MGGKSQPQTTQTNSVQLSPEQKKIFNLMYPSVQEAAGTDLKAYDGQTVAGFNPTETAAQQSLLGKTATLDGLAAQGNTAQNFLLDPALLSPDSNPYLKQAGDAITQSMTDNLTRNILPTLRSGDVVASGMYSGGNTKAGQAQGLAVGETQKNIGSSLSTLYNNAYGQGLNAMGNASANNSAVMANNLMGGLVTSGVGAQQRELEQAQLDAEQNKYYFNMMAPFLKSSELSSLIGAIPGGTGTSTVTGAQPQSGGLKGALGGAASGAAIGSAVPFIGTGIGAGLGALAGFFS